MLENNLVCRRGIWGMPKDKKKKKKSENEIIDTEQSRIKKFFLHPIVAAVTASLILAILGVGFNFLAGMYKLPKNISNINMEINELSGRMDKLEDTINHIEDTTGFMDAVDERVNTAISKASIEVHSDKKTTNIVITLGNGVQISNNFVNDEFYWTEPICDKSNSEIGTDRDSGKKCTAEQLENKEILIPYREGGQEVFFCGQFNENNRWDGKCLLNVYYEDKLIAINEAEYSDGKLKSYKQVMADTTGDAEVWSVSEKDVIDSMNGIRYGDTWNYYKSDDYRKDFKFEEVDVSDLLYVDSFRETINDKIERLYHGKTSDGTYNDKTGDAYLVKYTEAGKIKILYKGQFEAGEFKDLDNEDGIISWSITKNPDTDYMYYEGRFDKTAIDKTNDENFKNNLTVEQIQEILGGMEFNCELNWDETSGIHSE